MEFINLQFERGWYYTEWLKLPQTWQFRHSEFKSLCCQQISWLMESFRRYTSMWWLHHFQSNSSISRIFPFNFDYYHERWLLNLNFPIQWLVLYHDFDLQCNCSTDPLIKQLSYCFYLSHYSLSMETNVSHLLATNL